MQTSSNPALLRSESNGTGDSQILYTQPQSLQRGRKRLDFLSFEALRDSQLKVTERLLRVIEIRAVMFVIPYVFWTYYIILFRSNLERVAFEIADTNKWLYCPRSFKIYIYIFGGRFWISHLGNSKKSPCVFYCTIAVLQQCFVSTVFHALDSVWRHQ